MDVTPLVSQGQQIIQGYAAGTFRISGISYKGAVIVSADKTITWGNAPRSAEELTLKSFDSLCERADKIDVLLLGTGMKMAFVPPSLRQALSAKGLSVDVMDTGAACRTYNVLMAEGRRVVAVLMPT